MQDKLKFESKVLETTGRYSKGFGLPDYMRDGGGCFSREKTLEVILSEEYGYVDDKNLKTEVKIIDKKETEYAGKCTHTVFLFNAEKDGKHAEFTVNLLVPNKVKDAPLIVFPNFRRDIPDKYFPVEELMDMGVSVATFCYHDVTKDGYVYDFSDSLAALLRNENKKAPAGKIAIWAYAAGLVGQYMLDNGYVKKGSLYVAGHSRLGKTALLAAATNEIFDGCLSNCSGCGGAAIARENTGETVKKITDVVAYWFTDKYKSYAERENEMPFDQHYLLACIAPRKICITAATEDEWADMDAQYICAEAASAAYEEMGLAGFDRSKGYIKDGESNIGEKIAVNKRLGRHFFSREDWAFFIKFIKNNK